MSARPDRHRRPALTMTELCQKTWLSRDELARYLDKPTANAARQWALRQGVTFHQNGRVYKRADVDRAIEGADLVVERGLAMSGRKHQAEGCAK